jgi:hypothetical protein
MLYYLGSLTVYGTPDDPRISARVWRVSDTTRLGRVEVFSATKCLELPQTATPRWWLEESAERWLRR